MKVIGICGSPRPNGNTEISIRKTLDAIESEGIETELITLCDKPILPCTACMGCAKSPKCVQNDPFFEPIYQKLIHADGIILGSPVYFGSATPNIMALMDRASYVARMNGNLFKRKVGASIAVARRAGANMTFAQLNYFFLISEMIVPGSSYWNVGYGLKKGDINSDAEALSTFEMLGKNVAWLLKKIA